MLLDYVFKSRMIVKQFLTFCPDKRMDSSALLVIVLMKPVNNSFLFFPRTFN